MLSLEKAVDFLDDELTLTHLMKISNTSSFHMCLSPRGVNGVGKFLNGLNFVVMASCKNFLFYICKRAKLLEFQHL